MAEHVAFIGGGNMATSLIGGLVQAGRAGSDIWVSDVEPARLDDLRTRFRVHTVADNRLAAAAADVVLLAVKPQNMSGVAREVGEAIREREPLVVSIAAGVREPDIRRWLGFEAAIVRTMPNTPALVGAGATALFANRAVSAAQREAAESILGAVGLTLWVEEEALLDAVTAVSGSGPAYFFLLMELMIEAGTRMGLGLEAARRLTLQTALGAAKIAQESADEPAVLRARVTSPGGTTERALEILRDGDIRGLVTNAVQGARDRALELGERLGES